MPNTDQFDILLQFHQTVIQDLQHRILNDSLLTNLWVKSPFSRRIEQPVDPLEIKACWNKPNVAISAGSIELAADVSGGARQMVTGRILTLDGKVSAKQKIIPAIDDSQRPYACVEMPKPSRLALRKLKVTYEGSQWPPFLSELNPAREATLLRPVLATQLMGQLARIPLTYMPCSLPLSMPDKNGAVAVGALPIKRTVPSLCEAPASVVLGLMLDRKSKVPSSSPSVFPSQSSYNAAIALSEQGLNTLLGYLCKQEKATGQMQHSQFGQIHWSWETLTVSFPRQNVLHLSGMLVQQGIRTHIEAEVHCQLAPAGDLQCTLLTSNTTTMVAETLLASWNGLLKILFRSRAANKRDQDTQDRERLFQCFDLPASKLTVETVAQELVVTGEQFIIYYTIPKSLKEFQFELPPPKPVVIITQPHIPQQATQGAPVTIELDAQITKDSTPPYDYAWTSDLSPNSIPQFGSKFTVSSVPAGPVAGTGPQALTTAHLKVIDMFGQVSETQAPAKYIPYAKQERQQNSQASAQYTPDVQRKQHHSRRSIIPWLGLAGLALAGGIWWLGNSHADPQLPYVYAGHADGLETVEWSPDGQRIASGGLDTTIQIWDAFTGENVKTYSGHTAAVLGVAWSPDGKRLVSSSADTTLRIWDVATSETLSILKKHTDVVHDVSWSSDGQRIASASKDTTVQIWDATSTQSLYTYRAHNAEVVSVACSPDNRYVASVGYDGALRVWDVTNGASLFPPFSTNAWLHTVAWSPQGNYLALGGQNGRVEVVDMGGTLIYTYTGHSYVVRRVSWSPDGQQIASASLDNTAQIWDAFSGNHVSIYRGHTAWLVGIAWSPNGRYIASGSYDKTVQVWKPSS